jgi:hypothetical protein
VLQALLDSSGHPSQASNTHPGKSSSTDAPDATGSQARVMPNQQPGPQVAKAVGASKAHSGTDRNGVKLAVGDVVEVLHVANNKVFPAATATVADLNTTGGALWCVVPKTKVRICMKPIMTDAYSQALWQVADAFTEYGMSTRSNCNMLPCAVVEVCCDLQTLHCMLCF